MLEKARESVVERVRAFEIRQMAGAGNDGELRSRDAVVHRVGGGFRRDEILVADEDERGAMNRRQ